MFELIRAYIRAYIRSSTRTRTAQVRADRIVLGRAEAIRTIEVLISENLCNAERRCCHRSGWRELGVQPVGLIRTRCGVNSRMEWLPSLLP